MKEQREGHTPIPWIAQKLEADGLVIRREGWEIRTAEFDVCANILHGAPIRREADARLICLAVNNHKKLVGVVRRIVCECRSGGSRNRCDLCLASEEHGHRADCIVAEAESLLAEIEKEGK